MYRLSPRCSPQLMQQASNTAPFGPTPFTRVTRPAGIDALVSNLSAAKANAIFVQMRRRADSYCRLCREPFAEDASVPDGFDPLDDLIRKARPLNIEVHAWFVVYPGWPFATPPAAAFRHRTQKRPQTKLSATASATT